MNCVQTYIYYNAYYIGTYAQTPPMIPIVIDDQGKPVIYRNYRTA